MSVSICVCMICIWVRRLDQAFWWCTCTNSWRCTYAFALYVYIYIEICAMVKRWHMWHGHPSHMGLPDQWLHHVTISNDIWWPSMNIPQHQQAIWPGFVSWSYLVSPCEDAAGLGGASSRGSEQCYSDLWQNMTLVPLNPLFDHPLPKTDRNENSDTHRLQTHPCDVVRDISHSHPSN